MRTGQPADAYVFGNAVGVPIQSFRAASENTILRAHGHEPRRVRGKLTAESRSVLRRIDLHAHDLRREFASRLRESGAPDHVVGAWLGQANIPQRAHISRRTVSACRRT